MKSFTFLLLFTHLALLTQAQIAHQKDFIQPISIGETHTFYSTLLGEDRVLHVYLPEGYHHDDTTRYAVTYLLDGGMDEDFMHVVGLFHFYSFPWINQVPPTIVVGIANQDRRRDFTFPSTIKEDKDRFPTTGGSGSFIRFIEKEVQPYVSSRFRTQEDKTLIGQSLGGLLATEILFKNPVLFNRYMIISPSLWWDDGSLLNLSSELLLESFVRPTQVYIGVGKEGLAPCTQPHVMEVDANLLAEKIMLSKSKYVKVYFDYLPQENHATIGHQAVANGLKMIYR